MMRLPAVSYTKVAECDAPRMKGGLSRELDLRAALCGHAGQAGKRASWTPAANATAQILRIMVFLPRARYARGNNVASRSRPSQKGWCVDATQS